MGMWQSASTSNKEKWWYLAPNMQDRWKREFLPSWTISCRKRGISHFTRAAMSARQTQITFVSSLDYLELGKRHFRQPMTDFLSVMMSMFGLTMEFSTLKAVVTPNASTWANRRNQRYIMPWDLAPYSKTLCSKTSQRRSTIVMFPSQKTLELLTPSNSFRTPKYQPFAATLKT